MKVTVIFGTIMVVVPCGEGNFQVRDLINRAISRYKKATGKPYDSWVTIQNLKQIDGGILDPDDILKDVADDRERIIAIYDEALQSQQGDGTSSSEDLNNQSPELLKNMEHKFHPFTNKGIEVTGDELCGNETPLHVRHGSEPALNRLSPIQSYIPNSLDPSKRWSAAPVIEDEIYLSSTLLKDQIEIASATFYEGFPGERGEGSGEEKLSESSSETSSNSKFSRDTNRCSIQILPENSPAVFWTKTADETIESSKKRREPLGGADYSNKCLSVLLPNDKSPLGIHVIPSTNGSGHDQGLLVEGIEPNGRVAHEGSIQVHDVIIEINYKSLVNVTFQQAQEIFKDAMQDSELLLKILKKSEKYPRDNSRTAKKYIGNQSRNPSLSSRTQAEILQSNTKRIGKCLSVNLIKGSHGLGFSITTRDNPAGGEAPIYIKNILPRGAAIEEGNLKVGDRLLEINKMSLTGFNQPDVAKILRQIPVGGLAALVISRQEKHPSPSLPRELPSEKMTEDSLMLPWKKRDILTFEIPVHDSERAGLGVSVKGKTSSGPNGSIDLGIFVKNVIHGGAASRDGRLKMNDQLVNINELSLLGKSNSEAMKTLRTAMHQEEPTSGVITLTVARRVGVSKHESFNNSKAETCLDYLDSMNEGFESTNILKTRKEMELERQADGFIDAGCYSINPVIQRLTGSNAALRNESYYKATHDTWNTTHLHQTVEVKRELGSPTIDSSSRNTVLIHHDFSFGASSVEENVGEFSRDQFGRQSMSEKRHATLDAKNTDTYQRNKKFREEKEKLKKNIQNELYKKEIGEAVGPSLGMRKSSSLESLQTMVHEISFDETGKVPRSRGTNESFRAAVDRSYDDPTLAKKNDQMETLAEEDSESSVSGMLNSRMSSLTSSGGYANQKLQKNNIFKGIGSMFRFGKNKKTMDHSNFPEFHDNWHNVEKPKVSQNFPNKSMDRKENAAPCQDEELNYFGQQSRSQRMHQLRAEHQRRHALRNGVYPTENKELCYSQRQKSKPREPKNESYNTYEQNINKPGNRGAIVDPQTFSHYVNYEQIQKHLRKNKEQERLAKLANQQYQDFRDKQTRRVLSAEDDRKLQNIQDSFIHESIIASREQREYQSHRSTREVVNQHQQRPISNYFEYESVQGRIHHAQENTGSLLRSRPTQNRTNRNSRNKETKDLPWEQQDFRYATSGYRPASQYAHSNSKV